MEQDGAVTSNTLAARLDRIPGSRWLVGGAIFLLVPLAYFWLIGRYGWSDTDDGFVLGSAWRVYNGRAPYRDFIDVRPPTSAYLHSLWFAIFDPRYAYAAARMGAILQMWAYSLIATWTLAKAGGRTIGSRGAILALALTGFLLSATAFTPMPWHTVDGVFFCTLGAGLLIGRRGMAAAGLAALLIVLGMGAKQSFYPVAPLAAAYLLAQGRWKDAAAFAAAVALGLAAFAGWLWNQGALASFVQQTTARTGAGYVVAAGLATYRDMGLPFAAMALGAAAAAWGIALLLKAPFGRGAVAAVVATVIVADYLYRLSDGAWVNASTLGYPHALFLIAAAMAAWRVRRKAHRDLGLAALFLLGIAWCASLSIGFPTPLLFMAPLVAIPMLGPDATGENPPAPRPVFAWILAGFACVMAGLAALYPYEDRDPRAHASCALSTVEPKLWGIVSGPETCAKLAEYERMRRAFPGAFVTLPAFATSYMLAGALDPVGADWPTEAEAAGASPRLIAQADAKARYAFVEVAETAQSVDDQQSPLLDHVRKAWTLVTRGRVYAVYRNPHR